MSLNHILAEFYSSPLTTFFNPSDPFFMRLFVATISYHFIYNVSPNPTVSLIISLLKLCLPILFQKDRFAFVSQYLSSFNAVKIRLLFYINSRSIPGVKPSDYFNHNNLLHFDPSSSNLSTS